MADGHTGADLAKKLKSPRVFKCHLQHQLWEPNLDKNPNVKIIQTTRNPKDTLVSYYHHFRLSLLHLFAPSESYIDFQKCLIIAFRTNKAFTEK